MKIQTKYECRKRSSPGVMAESGDEKKSPQPQEVKNKILTILDKCDANAQQFPEQSTGVSKVFLFSA